MSEEVLNFKTLRTKYHPNVKTFRMCHFYNISAQCYSTSLLCDLLHFFKTLRPGKSPAQEAPHTADEKIWHMLDFNFYPSIFSQFLSLPGTETTAPHSLQPCQAVVCIVCHQITIRLAVGGKETVAPSVHIAVLKHRDSSIFCIRSGRCLRINCLYAFLLRPAALRLSKKVFFCQML